MLHLPPPTKKSLVSSGWVAIEAILNLPRRVVNARDTRWGQAVIAIGERVRSEKSTRKAPRPHLCSHRDVRMPHDDGQKHPGPEIGREESLERAGRFYERVVAAAAAATFLAAFAALAAGVRLWWALCCL